MSAFYDLASLVVVPSGYKASKVYAQKPLTTDGQLAFSRASTATRVNASGLIETVASNVPRLDYTDSTCPKLLLEPSRTNLLLQSSAFDNSSAWATVTSGTGVTPIITANNATAPDGTMSADTIVFNAGAGTTAADISTIAQAATAGSQTYSGSFYARVASGTGQILFRHAGGGQYTTANLTTTWQRFSSVETGTSTFEIGIRRGLANEPINASVTVEMWGAQLEAGAYPTSLIPTTTAAVTRLLDACSKTAISSLIGQTEGVIFIDWVYTERDSIGIIPITISNGTSSSVAYIYIDNNNNVFFDFIASGPLTARIQTGSGYAVKGTRYKMACAYKANDFVFYINGTQIGTDSLGAIAGMSQLDFGYPFSSGYSLPNTINQALLFKTRLTNAQLAELTSL